MRQSHGSSGGLRDAWELARSGELRRAGEATRRLGEARGLDADARVELHLVAAFCAMRQGAHAEAIEALDEAGRLAAGAAAGSGAALHVQAWRAELAYFQGRYSEAEAIVGSCLPAFESRSDHAYAAFVLRIRIAVLLARADYDAIFAVAPHATRIARSSGDSYVLVQVLNVLGAAYFDRATSKLRAPHARAHLSALDPEDAEPMQADAREALRLFEAARGVAREAGYGYAAWYVEGNIERLEILLGNAGRVLPAMRRRLRALQSRGARYDEIVTRSNLAWALRTLGRYPEALHELEVAMRMARDTGTSNVLLEFLEYDRSIVLESIGAHAAARASYRRYVQLVAAWNAGPGLAASGPHAGTAKRLLEPFYLKRADRFVVEHIAEPLAMSRLAEACGVSTRTLLKTFVDFRGITPVAHVRNLRLDHARGVLEAGNATVGEAARRSGFRSATTFALEFRKRFGITPRQAARK